MTSVRKLSLRPTQGQPPDKACPKVPVTRKPACGPAKSRTGVKLPVSSKPARVLVKSQANVAKPKQAKKPAEKGQCYIVLLMSHCILTLSIFSRDHAGSSWQNQQIMLATLGRIGQ